MTLIETIFGNKTKVKIIEILVQFPDGLTRNKIAEYSSLHPNNIYDQIDDLVFLDILTINGKLYLLNPNYVLFESLKSFIQLFTDYSENFSFHIVPFIHSKLKNQYYVTGYFAATRLITLIDYRENLLNIAILKPHYEYFNKKLSLLASIENISYQTLEAGKLSIFSFEQDSIPIDVKIERFEESDIFLSSITRGIIDCFRLPGTSDYGKCLILLQNELEGLLDYSILKEEYNSDTIPSNLLFVIHKLVDKHIGSFQQLKSFDKKTIKIEEDKRVSLQKALHEAISTVQGIH